MTVKCNCTSLHTKNKLPKPPSDAALCGKKVCGSTLVDASLTIRYAMQY